MFLAHCEWQTSVNLATCEKILFQLKIEYTMITGTTMKTGLSTDRTRTCLMWSEYIHQFLFLFLDTGVGFCEDFLNSYH